MEIPLKSHGYCTTNQWIVSSNSSNCCGGIRDLSPLVPSSMEVPAEARGFAEVYWAKVDIQSKWAMNEVTIYG
jgi:hypothetical protein